MTTLVDFLLARIQEDRVRATLRDWHQADCDWFPDSAGYAYPCDCGVPERLRAEADAKEAIVELWSNDAQYPDYSGGYESAMDDTLRRLAVPYADHPDYQPEWRP